MGERQGETPATPATPATLAQAHDPTGNSAVDQVVESLEQLEGAPVSEHVPVFENAHEKLREALADAGNEQAPVDGDDRPGY